MLRLSRKPRTYSQPTERRIMKLFQINEDDLSALEHVLPQLASDLYRELAGPAAPRIRKQLRQAQEILSKVRWNYGPPTDVQIIPAGE